MALMRLATPSWVVEQGRPRASAISAYRLSAMKCSYLGQVANLVGRWAL